MLFLDLIGLWLFSFLIRSSSNVTGPISRIHSSFMCPSPECMIAIASDVSPRLLIQREGKVLSIVDNNLKALIVNDRPEADVSFKVRGYVGEIETYIESACHVNYL